MNGKEAYLCIIKAQEWKGELKEFLQNLLFHLDSMTFSALGLTYDSLQLVFIAAELSSHDHLELIIILLSKIIS